MSKYSAATFRKMLWQEFRISVPGAEVEATLVQVRDLREAATDDAENRQFAVHWRGPRDANIGQGIFRVHTPDAQVLEVFLVTLGPDSSGMLYEAVFT